MKRLLLIGLLSLLILILFLFVKRRFFFPQEKAQSEEYGKVRVEIINCSGNPKIGKRILEHLRRKGFNVYDVIFDPETISKTIVCERRDTLKRNALLLTKCIAQKKRVGIFRREIMIMPEIKEEIDPNLFIDVSIILGRDFKRFFPEIAGEID